MIDTVRKMMKRLSRYTYGLYINGSGIISDSSRFHEFDPELLMIQTPEEFEKNKSGMYHDATVYIHKKLSDIGIYHLCIYLESSKKPYLSTHSFVVAKLTEEGFFVLDAFTVENGIYPNIFPTVLQAVSFRKRRWLIDEKFSSHSLYLRVLKNMPSGINIIDFMSLMREE